MGILGNEAADVLAKNAAEGVPQDDHDRWMSGGIRQWAKQRKRDYLEEGEDAVIGRAMGWRRKAATNYPEHIVFRCGKVRRVKDERGRRDWARENGMRWDRWHPKSG